MKRLLAALSVLAVVAIAAWTYDINYRTKNALREVDRLRAEIAMRHEEQQVLRVEWAYLNRPDRLKRLVEMNNDRLGLVPIGPERFGDVASVPFPPPPEVDPLEAALAAATAAGAFIPTPAKTSIDPAAAAAERLDGGVAFFPVRLAAGGPADAALALPAAVGPAANHGAAPDAEPALALASAEVEAPQTQESGNAAAQTDAVSGAVVAAVPMPPRRPEALR
ncbi:hypothetical protein H0I76_10685 [Limibaculum sp. M0105]|uniref:Cell division protein FtsL n=1 Tax=Thermohalobaculum xanthum TaxID=2753746 RepID=A0A8J7M797_9RHOB|nr:hypothetical protein [Thermohalobaculum xanthum]MBK0399659.1 hypothetical protein [Thermohalobaculum xanthum]